MFLSLVKKMACLGVALGLVSGCYSSKMMDFTYQQLDTVKTNQQELLDRVEELARLYEEERETRIRTQAELNLAIQELRETLDVLGYRMDDNAQLFLRSSTAAAMSRRMAAAVDSAFGGRDSLSTPPDSAGGLPPAIGDDEAGKLFQSSYMDLTLGNYDLSVQGFKNYLVRFPQAPNVPEAHYYLGESYYSLSRYLEAVAEYQSVIREYSHSRLVPACYLKSGYCYQNLEEKQLAEKTFRELISIYPRSEEAEQARVALQEQGG
ncbi:MAG: tol-pal system protein YbgF [Candidatus Latescibacterota bacterium]|nr:MAG: tol-pal system protein YbgF [Candidatus Latescibacterota bacterium]